MLRCVPWICLLALVACEPEAIEEPLPTPPETTILLDDFTTDPLDGVWRWDGGDTERRVVEDGAARLETRLAHAVTPGHTEVYNRLRPKVDGRVDAISAVLEVDRYETVYASARALVTLAYQPEADRGTDRNLLLVRVGMHATDTNALRTAIQSFHCVDEGCTTSHPLAISAGDFPHNVHTSTDTPHRFTVRFEEDAERFVLEVDGRRATLDASTLVGFDPDDFLYAEVRNDARRVVAPGDVARMDVRVHEVSLDGVPYDDFTGARLDPTKWESGDLERRLDPNGGFTLALGHADENRTLRLPLRAALTAQELAATVRVDEVVFDDESPSPPIARIGGHWYTDGSSQDGGGATGNIYAGIGIVGGSVVRWDVVRCLAPDCADRDLLGSGELGETAVGEAEDLYVGVEDSVFTFRRGDQTATFDAAAAGAARVGDPTIATTGLEARYPFQGDGPAYVRANFSNVRTDPPGSIEVGDAAWMTHQSVGGGLRGVVAVGAHEDGTVLHATRGAADGMRCSGDDCLALRLEIEADEAGYRIDRAYDVTGSWQQGASTSEVAGTLTFTRVDGRAEGTFSLTAAGDPLSGSFTAPWHASATVSPRGGAEANPIAVHGGCASWPFCAFATSPDASTWLAVPKAPADARAFRLTEGGAGLKVYSETGSLLCTSTRVADEHVCRTTGGGSTLFAEITPDGEHDGPPVVYVHEDYADVVADQATTQSVDVGTARWFRVRGATAPHVVETVAHDRASDNIELYDREGRYAVGNGWCCGEGNTQQSFLRDPKGTLWARVTAHADQSWVPYTESSTTFTLRPRTVEDGTSPDDAVAVTATRAYWSFNHIFARDEALHVRFEMPTTEAGAHSGPGLLRAEVMDWRPVQSPIDLLLYTDPADPEGSAVRTSDGEACASTLRDNGGAGRWEAICYALFDAEPTYYARLGGPGVLRGTHAAFRVDTFWETDTRVTAPDVEHAGTHGPGEAARYVAWTEAGKGYNHVGQTYDTGGNRRGLGLGMGSLSTPTPGCTWFCWRGLGGIGTSDWDDPIRTHGFFVDADQAPLFIYFDIRNWESGGAPIDFDTSLRETGGGLTMSDPAEIDDPVRVHQDGHLDPGVAHHYTFVAEYTTYALQVHASDPDYGATPTWAGGWTLHAGEDTIAACAPDHEQRARCDVALQAGATYVLRVHNDDEQTRIRYTIRGER